MIRGSVFFLFLVFIGCTSPKSDRIVVPELHAGFYSEALETINDELDSDPDNIRLVDQKIFYCEQLDWPTTCIAALDAHKEANGMTNQLVEQYISYYEKHRQYQQLLDVINRWGEKYDLEDKFTETYINCLTRLDYKELATIALKEYLKENQSNEAVAFASRQYLFLNDTTMAAYNLGKLYRHDKSDDLMWEYGRIMVSLGYLEVGFDALERYKNRFSNDVKLQLTYADILFNNGRRPEARAAIRPYLSEDTISYLLAEYYQEDLMWDSAGYVLSTIVEKDSSAREPLWRLGRLYEDRGWFLSAIPYFEYLLELNQGDTIAQKRIDLIQRKIAYLQRLKFEENKIPTIELKPKKLEN